MSPIVVVSVMALVLAACGGEEANPPGSGSSEAADDSGASSSGDDGTPSIQDGDSEGSQDASSVGEQDGFVTVDGTTFAFTYDNLGRCGAEVGDGSIVSFGNLIDDPERQVTFTYGLPEDMASGEPVMQVIVMAEDGTQLYYSAVGFGSSARGSVDTITKDGNTVRITGQLERVADQTLVDFEAEATCDQ